MIRNKQWICNLIALFILISGMCFDEVKADSVLVSPEISEMISLEAGDAVFSDIDIEPGEMLCTRSTITSSQIAAQIINSRRVIKLSTIFLCVVIFALLLSNFYATERVEEFTKFSMRTAVLNYIHNADGKK